MDTEEVLVVARTRFSSYLCVGAVTTGAWEARRLVPAGGTGTKAKFWPTDTPFKPGLVFEIDFEDASIKTPHVEDVLVHEHRHVRTLADLTSEIASRADVFEGALTDAFDGTLVEEASNGNIGVGKAEMPNFSTQFWWADCDMERADTSWKGKTTPRLKTVDGVSVPYVGDDDAPDSVAVGDLVRLSLARWLGNPPVCWLQISHVYES